MPSLRIVAFIVMEDCIALEERLAQLMELDEDQFLVGFYQ